jgi:hypothetical protein
MVTAVNALFRARRELKMARRVVNTCNDFIYNWFSFHFLPLHRYIIFVLLMHLLIYH